MFVPKISNSFYVNLFYQELAIIFLVVAFECVEIPDTLYLGSFSFVRA